MQTEDEKLLFRRLTIREAIGAAAVVFTIGSSSAYLAFGQSTNAQDIKTILDEQSKDREERKQFQQEIRDIKEIVIRNQNNLQWIVREIDKNSEISGNGGRQ